MGHLPRHSRPRIASISCRILAIDLQSLRSVNDWGANSYKGVYSGNSTVFGARMLRPYLTRLEIEVATERRISHAYYEEDASCFDAGRRVAGRGCGSVSHSFGQ